MQRGLLMRGGAEDEGTSSSDDSDDVDCLERRAAKRARGGGVPLSASQSSEEGPIAPPTSPVPSSSSSNPGRRGGPRGNSIWADVLTEQSLASGLSAAAGASVRDSKDIVPRDVESFPLPAHLLNRPKPKHKPNSFHQHHHQHRQHNQAKPGKQPSSKDEDEKEEGEMEEGDADGDGNDEPFHNDHTEAPEPLSQEGKGKRHRNRGKGSKERKARNKEAPKPVGELTLKEDANPILLAGAMAEALSEPKVELIEKVLEEVGAAKAIQVFHETAKVQTKGGMRTLRGDRLRTPGGVFLFLVREDSAVSAPAKHRLFVEEKGKERKFAKVKRSLADPNKTFDQILAETKQALLVSKTQDQAMEEETPAQSEELPIQQTT